MWIKTNPELPVHSQLKLSTLSDQEMALILEDIQISRSGLGGVANSNKGIEDIMYYNKETHLVYSNTPREGEHTWGFNFGQEITKPVTFNEAFIAYLK